MRRLSLVVSILLLAIPPAPGQARYDDAAWRELWRRIEREAEVESLLRRLPAPIHPPAAKNDRAGQGPGSSAPHRPVGSPSELVRQIACQLQLDPALALALIEQESGFHHPLRGRAGELGAAQILPATAGMYGFDSTRLANDFLYNVRAGLSILKQLLKETGDEVEALSAYNGGPGWRSSSSQAQQSVKRYAIRVLQRRESFSRIGCTASSPLPPSLAR